MRNDVDYIERNDILVIMKEINIGYNEGNDICFNERNAVAYEE